MRYIIDCRREIGRAPTKSMTSWLGLIDPTTGSFHGFKNQGHRVYVFNAAQCMCLVGVGCLFADASNVHVEETREYINVEINVLTCLT